MKIKQLCQLLGLALMLLISFTSAAYENDKKDELCHVPKVQEFSLPEYTKTEQNEVVPESEFSFVISGNANPKKIKLEAKGKDIPFTVDSKETFHKVTGKLPKEFNGKFVRLNARIPAILDCYANQGWLLKVAAEKAPAPVAPEPSPAISTPIPAAEPAVKPATEPSSSTIKPDETTAPPVAPATAPPTE